VNNRILKILINSKGGIQMIRYSISARVVALILAAMCLASVFSGCNRSDGKTQAGPVIYTSYREIPGITDEEIQGIELLKGKYGSFVYGAMPATEAFYDNDGSIRGFTALMCEWLTELFDIRFVPALYEWNDLIAGLESGEIDFAGDLTATEERRKTSADDEGHIYYMTDAIAERTIKLMRLMNSAPLSDIAASRKLRYAFLDGTTTEDDIRLHSGEDFEAIYIDDYPDAYELLKNGSADAFIDEGPAEAAFDEYGDVFAKNFFPLIFSPVSLSTQKKELWPIISVVQKAIENGGLRYLTHLYNLGDDEYVQHKMEITLTETEHKYIQDHPVIKFVAEHDNYPVSFYNEYDDAWQGIVFDILDRIEVLTGLKYEIVNSKDDEWPVILSMLETGKASMISELIRSHDREGRFIWPAHAIMSDIYALISKTDFNDLRVNEILYANVGLVQDTAHAALFRRWFPNHINTKPYDTVDDAFDGLRRGEVDVVMSSQNQLLILTNYLELVGFKANVVFDRPYDSTFGFSKNEDTLCSIIDKALALIDTNEISAQWTRRTYDYTAKLAQAQRPWLIGASVLLLFVLVLIIIMFYRNRREGKRLEELVHKRTSELLAASHAKSDFLANMSHEMRTPMNAIIGMTTIAETAEDLDRIKYAIGKIKDASKHLLGVINDILDMSKIEAGKFELSPAEFDFEKLLKRVVNVINFRVDEKSQQLSVYIDRTIPVNLIGDDQRLAQVMTNLLSNAVKFTPENGSINLHTYLLGEEDGVCRIKITVKDTGIGITPEQQANLFQSFQQAESKTTRKFGGTGLGLAISKRIVEMMDGEIWVESEFGKGSTFAFTVSIRHGDETVQKDRGIDWKNIRILAVDDERYILQDFKGIVEKFGASCDIAENGQDALKLLADGRDYNLFFVDWKMPGMGGIELTEEIRKRVKKQGDSFVIMISAAESSSIAGKAKDAGVDKLMMKPLFPSTISELVSEYFGLEELVIEDEQENIDDIFAGRRILIAEDVEINREIVLALLEPTLIEIDFAVNGVEAHQKFSDTLDRYDMIFMDIQMPEMDGYEATRRIRAFDVPKAQTIPIVAMTANVFKEDIEKCLEAGMNDHVGKPVNIAEVLEALKKYLPERR
jgi:signal transduction histidine kinase/CheY-like chemotaxis protein